MNAENPIPIRKLDKDYDNNSQSSKYKWYFTLEKIFNVIQHMRNVK